MDVIIFARRKKNCLSRKIVIVQTDDMKFKGHCLVVRFVLILFIHLNDFM